MCIIDTMPVEPRTWNFIVRNEDKIGPYFENRNIISHVN